MDTSAFAITGTAPKPVVSPIQPTVSPVQQPQVAPSVQPTPQGGLDPKLVNLAQAIRQTESQGNFQAKGASGEYGAYQFMPDTWNASAPKFGVNVPLEQATPQQQNEVAYKQLQEWQQQHPDWNVGNFASAWNAGPGKPDAYLGNSGTNAKGVSYDTAAYAQKVATNYQQFKGQTQQPQQPIATDQNQPLQAPSIGGFLGNVVQSGANFAGNLVNAVAHPLQTGQNILETGAGALQEAGGQTNDNTAKFDQLKNYFGQRYGSISNLEHTIYADPVGFAADLSTVLGTGAGIAGAVGKVGELGDIGEASQLSNAAKVAKAGGADFVVGPSGVAASTAEPILNTAQKVGSALGTGAKYTNPLTPAVVGASALLDTTKNFSNIIKNPQDYTPEQIANSSGEKITGDVSAAFDAKRATLSETGSGYAPFKTTPTAITAEPDSIDNTLRNSLKVEVTDGVIKPTSTSLLRDSTSINKLQAIYNTYKPDFLNGSMDSEKLLNLRTDLGKIAFNDLGIKNTDVAFHAAKVRGVINDSFRSQVPGLSELDSSYEAQINKLSELENGIVYKTGANKGELKTSFLNSAMKAVKNEDTDKLAQLEEILPGITKRLQVMKTIKDLGNPSFTTSLIEKGGLGGSLLTGNIKGAALALSSIILSKPAIAIPLLRAVGANMELVKAVMGNLARSLTTGAVEGNVSNTTPQEQQQPSATSQTQPTGEPQTTQMGSPSPNTTTPNFDYQGAKKAGYSDAEIQQFLKGQN